MKADDKSFRGSFLLYRKAGSAAQRVGGARPDRGGGAPRFRHPSYEAARAEAERLLPSYPQSTFIIMQEVGRVKLKPDPVSDEAVAWAREQAANPPAPYLSPEREAAFREKLHGSEAPTHG